MARWVVFSDLDGTLLDHRTYGFEAARPVVAEVSRRGIPIVPCTSKTAAETIHFQGLLGIAGPFIVEDGGGVGVPRGYFAEVPRPHEERGEYVLVPLCARRKVALAALAAIKTAAGGAIRGFSDMTEEEVAAETGLPLELARLARRREFDEPFRFLGREIELVSLAARIAAERGLRVSKGERYYHLHGETDKGKALALVTRLFREKLGGLRTIGIGDSAMDLPMLRAVDVPLAVQKADGTHDPALVQGVPGLRRVSAPGPKGWGMGIREAVEKGS